MHHVDDPDDAPPQTNRVPLSQASGRPSLPPEPKAPITERQALAWCAAAAVAAIAWITLPVGVGILIGMLMGFTFQPVYELVHARLRRPELSALATVLLAAIAVIGSIGGLGALFVTKGTSLARALLGDLAPGGTAESFTERLTPIFARFGVTAEVVTHRLRNAASEIASRAAVLAETIASATATALLALFFALLTMHYILRNWRAISLRAQEVLPLRPSYTRALFDEFRRVGRTTFLGTIVTGIAQGVLATIGFWMTGVPEPVFFGAATAVASLIPAVGTLIVWVPAGIVLILTGHVTPGVLELLWGAAMTVGVSDYVIRPRLVGGEDTVPTLVTFAALFGGVEVFGLKGLILGPVVMSLAIAVLRIYAREASAARLRGTPPEDVTS